LSKAIFSIFLALLLIFSSSVQVYSSYAQDNILSNITSLSFVKVFPLLQDSLSLEGSGVSIGIGVDTHATFREDVILLTESSRKYAERETVTILTMSATSALSLIELSGEIDISLAYGAWSTNVPVNIVDMKLTIPTTIGSSNYMRLAETQLYSGTVPIVGIQVSIYMRPMIQYSTALRGDLLIQGPASATPTNLLWNQKTVTSQISFSQTTPIDVQLDNPKLLLNSFSISLEFRSVITFVPTPYVPLQIVSFTNYEVGASKVHLISFDPDYYALYTELQTSVNTLTSTLEEIQNNLMSLSNDISNLNHEVSSMNTMIQAIDLQINNVEGLTSNLSQNISAHESQIISLSTKVDGLSDDIINMVNDLSTLNTKVNQFTARDESSFIIIAIVSIVVSVISFGIALLSISKLGKFKSSLK
jgi:hypothetical protein